MAGGLRVKQGSVPGGIGDDTFASGLATRLGTQVMSDFYLYSALLGRAFQVRAGTITTPLIGDVVLTDAAAEMATAAAANTTIIPVALGVAVRLGTGTLHEYAAKSAAVATMSAGTAFVALPLRTLGPQSGAAAAAVSTSMVGAAGGVTVAVEAITTTRRHWEFSNPLADAAGSDLGIAGVSAVNWNPRVPPVLVGPASFYVQIAATNTGPSYYAHYDFLEYDSATLIG